MGKLDLFLCGILPGGTISMCGTRGEVVYWSETLSDNNKAIDLHIVLKTNNGEFLGVYSKRDVDRTIDSYKPQYNNATAALYHTRYDACAGKFPVKPVPFSF